MKNTFHKVNIIVFAAVLAGISLILLFSPRPGEEEIVQKRLSPFPEFSFGKFFSGDFTRELNLYFSDTVPGRDGLVETAAWLKSKMGFEFEEVAWIRNPSSGREGLTSDAAELSTVPDTSAVGIHTVTTVPDSAGTGTDSTDSAAQSTQTTPPVTETVPPVNNGEADFAANEGVLIVDGNRALMITGWYYAGDRYCTALNEYNRRLENTSVYSMLIPSSIEFYAPPKWLGQFGIDQRGVINKMYGMLDGAIPVDVYPELSAKVHEDIFLRTDHHWAPLGAYYAAEKFAEVAGVPFAPLSDYDVSVVPNYVGSMYSYSGKDPRVGNSPEDFVYYKPRNSYKTTYYNTYTGQNPSVAVEGSLFVEGMNLADTYSTFMGGDAKITHITTDVKNGRKLAIIKESMGNALVPFFTNSFEEIYVIDVRFFPYNAVSYLSERGVTDLLFATSMAMANDGGFVGKIEGLMGN